MRNMKKKVIIVFFCIISLMFGFVTFYGIALPPYGNNHSTCHSSTGYTIGTNVVGDINAINSSNVVFNITATGTNLFVQAIPNAESNNLFVFLPTTNRINDNSIYDSNPTADSIVVEFNITTPAVTSYYTIFIIAGNDTTESPINFAYIQININVAELDAIPLYPGFIPGYPLFLIFGVFIISLIFISRKIIKKMI